MVVPMHSVTTSVLILVHLKAIVYGARQHEDSRGMQLRISVQKRGGHSTGVISMAQADCSRRILERDQQSRHS